MSKTLLIKVSEYTLSAAQIDNLSSEYYGKILPLTNNGDEKDMEIEFFSEECTSQTLVANFMIALNNFRPKKGLT